MGEVLLPNEAFPTDLNVSKCDDFKDPRGYYALLGCGKISSDSKIKDALLRDKSTFRRIPLTNHPDKLSNPKYHDKFKVANNKWEMVNAAYNIFGMSDDVRDFHLRCEFDKLGDSLRDAFRNAFTTVHNVISLKKRAAYIQEQHKRNNIYQKKWQHLHRKSMIPVSTVLLSPSLCFETIINN